MDNFNYDRWYPTQVCTRNWRCVERISITILLASCIFSYVRIFLFLSSFSLSSFVVFVKKKKCRHVHRATIKLFTKKIKARVALTLFQPNLKPPQLFPPVLLVHLHAFVSRYLTGRGF